MLFGVDTPKIDIPFSITMASACKIINLEFSNDLSFLINLNSSLSFPAFQ